MQTKIITILLILLLISSLIIEAKQTKAVKSKKNEILIKGLIYQSKDLQAKKYAIVLLLSGLLLLILDGYLQWKKTRKGYE